MNVLEAIASEFPSPPPPVDQKKRCTRCTEWKPLSEYYPRWKDEPTIGTVQSMCKDCYRATYVGEYRKSLKLKKAGLL